MSVYIYNIYNIFLSFFYVVNRTCFLWSFVDWLGRIVLIEWVYHRIRLLGDNRYFYSGKIKIIFYGTLVEK